MTAPNPTAEAASLIPWWHTRMGDAEAEACAQAVRSRHLSRGPLTEALEARISAVLGVEEIDRALCVPSGSMGLWLALMALDVGPGDEVIVPDLTWIATAHAASLLGAKVVLVDCLPDRPVIDPAAVEAAITPRTRVVLPVHLTGRAAPMGELRTICDRHGIDLVEDAAQAFYSRAPEGPLGTLGRVGVYSLGMAKLVSTGQGGAVVTRDAALRDRLFRATLHGVANDVGGESYLHRGFNMKFTDLQAALGLAQLDRLQQKVHHVRTIHERYAAGLADVAGIQVEPFDLAGGELPLWTEVRCADREHVRRVLGSAAIETHLLHRPLHHAEHLVSGGAGAYPNAERHSADLLILPSGPSQPLGNVDRVIEVLSGVESLA